MLTDQNSSLEVLSQYLAARHPYITWDFTLPQTLTLQKTHAATYIISVAKFPYSADQ